MTLHPNYLTDRTSGCEICILGYVHFTPYADPGDIHRLMQINFPCLTRLHPCLDQNDIMPSAWKQYLVEDPRAEARKRSCILHRADKS